MKYSSKAASKLRHTHKHGKHDENDEHVEHRDKQNEDRIKLKSVVFKTRQHVGSGFSGEGN